MDKLFFDESLILLDLKATTKEEVLSTMGQHLLDLGLVKETFISAILRRESEFPTGLPTEGIPVAIPHTDSEHVIRNAISVAVLKRSVPFVIMGTENETVPVKIIFLLALKNAETQLNFLQKLVSLLKEQEILRNIANEKNKKKIRKILVKKLGLF